MSRIVRKQAFCICENKDADQLRGNCMADQHHCFRYIDSTILLLPKPLAILCDHTAQFVLDLVGNPKDRFSHDAAHIEYMYMLRTGTDHNKKFKNIKHS